MVTLKKQTIGRNFPRQWKNSTRTGIEQYLLQYRKTLIKNPFWVTQISNTSGLLHVCFIYRKTEPLGEDFKSVAC